MHFGQYRDDIFEKLSVDFKPGKSLLDVGCGSGDDAEVFVKKYKLKTTGIDVYKPDELKVFDGFEFKLVEQGIYDLPFEDNSFDYVFLHDVLHHIDEQTQKFENHKRGLQEVNRVLKKDGLIVIVEGNRYNPLFFPHMVMMLGHEHFPQNYFISLVNSVFDEVEYKYFECHFYPQRFLGFFKVYEWLMEKFIPKRFLAYNVALARKVRA